MLPALHAPFIACSFLTIYTLSCQCVRRRIHSSISPRTFEHESYQTKQRRHTVTTILVCMQFPHHLYSKLPISWMQDKRRNAGTSTAIYPPNIVEAHCCIIRERKRFFKQFAQHRCNTINQDVSTRGSSLVEQLKNEGEIYPPEHLNLDRITLSKDILFTHYLFACRFLSIYTLSCQ